MMILNILSNSKQVFLAAGPHDCKLTYFLSCIGQQNIINFPIDGWSSESELGCTVYSTCIQAYEFYTCKISWHSTIFNWIIILLLTHFTVSRISRMAGNLRYYTRKFCDRNLFLFFIEYDPDYIGADVYDFYGNYDIMKQVRRRKLKIIDFL